MSFKYLVPLTISTLLGTAITYLINLTLRLNINSAQYFTLDYEAALLLFFITTGLFYAYFIWLGFSEKNKNKKTYIQIIPPVFVFLLTTAILLIYAFWEGQILSVFFAVYSLALVLINQLIFLVIIKNTTVFSQKMNRNLVIILTLTISYLFLLSPKLTPGINYKYLGGSNRAQAIKEGFSHIKKGDGIESINKALPGLLNKNMIKSCPKESKCTLGGSYHGIKYHLSLEYGIVKSLRTENY